MTVRNASDIPMVIAAKTRSNFLGMQLSIVLDEVFNGIALYVDGQDFRRPLPRKTLRDALLDVGRVCIDSFIGYLFVEWVHGQSLCVNWPA